MKMSRFSQIFSRWLTNRKAVSSALMRQDVLSIEFQAYCVSCKKSALVLVLVKLGGFLLCLDDFTSNYTDNGIDPRNIRVWLYTR